MTNTQKKALQEMSDRNIGALPINGVWVFPEHVRESDKIAAAVLRTLSKSKE